MSLNPSCKNINITCASLKIEPCIEDPTDCNIKCIIVMKLDDGTHMVSYEQLLVLCAITGHVLTTFVP